jgi:hypothetical protein
MSFFRFFFKIRISEFTQFFAKLLAEKTPEGTRLQVNKENYVGYVHSRLNGLTICLVTDKGKRRRKLTFKTILQE